MSELWTVERLVELERRVIAGEPAASIAQLLGLEPAQVMGKARRMGLRIVEGDAAPAAPVEAPSLAPSLPAEPEPVEEPATPVVEAPPLAPAASSAGSIEIDVGDPNEGWTPRRIAALKALWAQGLSLDAIARRLRGVSRNAISGKVDRLGLTRERRRPEWGPKPRQVPTKPEKTSVVQQLRPKVHQAPKPPAPLRPRIDLAPKSKPAPTEALVAAQEDYDNALAELEKATSAGDFPHAVDLMGLTSKTCRFPLWRAEAAPFSKKLFCGAKHQPGSPYCPGHTALSLPAPARRRA